MDLKNFKDAEKPKGNYKLGERRVSIPDYMKDDNKAHLSNTFMDLSDVYRRKREKEEKSMLMSAQEARELSLILRKERFSTAREEDDQFFKSLEDQDTDDAKEDRVLDQIRQSSPQLRLLQDKLKTAELYKQRHNDVFSYPIS